MYWFIVIWSRRHFSFCFETKQNSVRFQNRKKIVSEILFHSIWKEMENYFSAFGDQRNIWFLWVVNMYAIKNFTLAHKAGVVNVQKRDMHSEFFLKIKLLDNVFSLCYYSNIFTSHIQCIWIDVMYKHILLTKWYHSYQKIISFTREYHFDLRIMAFPY